MMIKKSEDVIQEFKEKIIKVNKNKQESLTAKRLVNIWGSKGED